MGPAQKGHMLAGGENSPLARPNSWAEYTAANGAYLILKTEDDLVFFRNAAEVMWQQNCTSGVSWVMLLKELWYYGSRLRRRGTPRPEFIKAPPYNSPATAPNGSGPPRWRQSSLLISRDGRQKGLHKPHWGFFDSKSPLIFTVTYFQNP